MAANLIEELLKVEDFRAARGKRYPLWLILLLVVMGTMSGCLGYQALEDFGRRHHQALAEQLQLPTTNFPSDSTLRRVMKGINFILLAQIFNQWVSKYVPTPGKDWVGVDGKSIKGTVSNYDNAYQDFVSIVSVFSTNRGVTLALEQFRNKENSEIAIVQALLSAIDLQQVVFTFDSLHCQKKPLS